MIENYENVLQSAVLFVCLILSLRRAVLKRDKAWVLLTLFYASFFLGDAYWLLCLVFYGDTPLITIVSDLNWYASFILLYLLIMQILPPDLEGRKRLFPWAGPVFSAAMAIFYMQYGAILSNLVYASLMGLLLYASLSRIGDRLLSGKQRFFCLTVLLFCMIIYGLWTVSCFWDGDTLQNPYYWFDILLTGSFPFLEYTVKKAVTG